MKALVALGANVNADIDSMTALKFALEKSGRLEESTAPDRLNDSRGFETTVQPGSVVDTDSNRIREEKIHCEDMCDLLKSVGATSHCDNTQNGRSKYSDVVTCESQLDHNKVALRYKELNDTLKSKRHEYELMQSPAVACDVLKVLQEVETYCKAFGSRILCLDGGGIRGLVQIQVLRQIENETRKNIVDLFDWIVGTSTGGIIALALVYGMYYVYYSYSYGVEYDITYNIFFCSKNVYERATTILPATQERCIFTKWTFGERQQQAIRMVLTETTERNNG